jgi:hypothetical protein
MLNPYRPDSSKDSTDVVAAIQTVGYGSCTGNRLNAMVFVKAAQVQYRLAQALRITPDFLKIRAAHQCSDVQASHFTSHDDPKLEPAPLGS